MFPPTRQQERRPRFFSSSLDLLLTLQQFPSVTPLIDPKMVSFSS